ncbi:MAG: hypothetical protein K0R76_64 [Alphaproteobacteria bacterium]|jgi:hypothetical protein|nr:hypothetical protein [Alphaproteobacteria bacterium]MDF3033110.1 hypothetical protein [Alphaproteobacteria bacterium]
MAERFVGFGAQLGLGVALALGIFGSSVYVSKTIEKIKSSDHAIEVKGYAERKITSDTALWRGTLVIRGKDLALSYQKLEADKKQVLAFLEKEGLKAELSPVVKDTLYVRTSEGINTNVVDGFVLHQDFSITSHDVHKIADLAIKIDQINGQGLEFESRDPRYFYSRDKLDPLKVELLGEATKNAKERADQFAKVSASSVGRLMSARQGIFQVTPENSTDLSDTGAYDTSTIDKVVKIVVTLSYATS